MGQEASRPRPTASASWHSESFEQQQQNRQQQQQEQKPPPPKLQHSTSLDRCGESQPNATTASASSRRKSQEHHHFADYSFFPDRFDSKRGRQQQQQQQPPPGSGLSKSYAETPRLLVPPGVAGGQGPGQPVSKFNFRLR